MLIAYVKGVIYSRTQYLTLYNCLMSVSCSMWVEWLAISKEHCNLCFSYIATLPLQIVVLFLNSTNSSFIFEVLLIISFCIGYLLCFISILQHKVPHCKCTLVCQVKMWTCRCGRVGTMFRLNPEQICRLRPKTLLYPPWCRPVQLPLWLRLKPLLMILAWNSSESWMHISQSESGQQDCQSWSLPEVFPCLSHQYCAEKYSCLDFAAMAFCGDYLSLVPCRMIHEVGAKHKSPTSVQFLHWSNRVPIVPGQKSASSDGFLRSP